MKCNLVAKIRKKSLFKFIFYIVQFNLNNTLCTTFDPFILFPKAIYFILPA
ncbi:hypothetical protein Hanom_Chr04g00336141 [Helianthus anomalus]